MDTVKKLNKKQWIILSVILAVIVVLIVVVCILVNTSGKKGADTSSLTEGQLNSMIAGIVSAAEGGQVADVSQPTNAIKENVNKPIVNQADDITENAASDTYPYSIKNGALRILNIQKYNGYFVEDGSNAETSGALAAVFQNTSGKEIHHARVEMKSDKSAELAVFDMSFIKDGEKVFVQEKNNRKYIEGEKFTVSDFTIEYLKYENGFIEDFNSIFTVSYELRSEGNGAAIYNKTKEPINGYIFYKQKVNGMLYGGITYRITLPYAINADTSLHIHAVHYNTESVVVAAQML